MDKKTNADWLREVAHKQLEDAKNISILQNDVNDLKADVKEILFYMRSDPHTKQRGLVEQVGLNTHFRNDLNSKSTLFGIVGGVISGVFFWLMNLIINNN